jgi:hypothetical protein
MIKVKISTYLTEWPFFRQTPGERGIWGDVQFFLNDDSIKESDYWIIYGGLSKIETAVCPKDNVVFFTVEPPSIKTYNNRYLRQFAKVITCHRNIKHKNKIYWQQGHPWHIGRKQINHRNIEFSKNYDELKSMGEICKTKLLSVISSSKTYTKGHRDRLKFVFFLKEYFEDKIDIFGRGINEIEDKWDAIVPYKYHISLENECYDNWVTEKLSDTFLAGSYPIYYGAGNIYSYFAKDSLTCINIYRPKDAVKEIKKVIANHYYEKYKSKILESKMKVLDEYNLFPTIVNKIINADIDTNKQKSEIILNPENFYGNGKQKLKKILREFLPEGLTRRFLRQDRGQK